MLSVKVTTKNETKNVLAKARQGSFKSLGHAGAAIRDAFLNKTSIELAVMDGDVATAGSQGLRATCMITNFSRNEALEEAITVSVTAKPTYSANPPSWFTVP